jgi:hypothetical protein
MNDLRRVYLDERREEMRVAAAVAKACADGDSAAFLAALGDLSWTVDGWRHAMMRIGRLGSVSPEIRAAFLPVWIESKTLPLRIGHRPTTAKGLRVLLAGNLRPAGPLALYRGTTAYEARRRLYGFSWSTDRAKAAGFAEGARRWPGGAAVLSATVEPDAVLLMREPEGYYDEGEVVVDPYRLRGVAVVERLAQEGNPAPVTFGAGS